MVDCSNRQLRSANRSVGEPQAIKCLSGCDLVHKVQIDVYQGWFAMLLVNDVLSPDLFEHGFGRHRDLLADVADSGRYPVTQPAAS